MSHVEAYSGRRDPVHAPCNQPQEWEHPDAKSAAEKYALHDLAPGATEMRAFQKEFSSVSKLTRADRYALHKDAELVALRKQLADVTKQRDDFRRALETRVHEVDDLRSRLRTKLKFFGD